MTKAYRRRGKIDCIKNVCPCCLPFGGIKGAKKFSRRWVRRTEKQNRVTEE